MAVSASGILIYTSDSGTYEIIGGSDGYINLGQLK